MNIAENVSDLKSQIRQWKKAGLTVGFVPTMGNLHQGHGSLVEVAKQKADKVVVSIFVNPMQFDNADDLDKYPRTIDDDCAVLKDLGTDLLFLPTPDIVYPKGMEGCTFIEVPVLSDMFCGASRPGHFRGVTTVVNKLFNLVEPDLAVFGEKDFQQLLIIRRMVEDLFMNVEIIGSPTKRETSGLAMSSRNNRLTDEQRNAQAPIIYRALCLIRDQIKDDNKEFNALEQAAIDMIDQAGLNTDFVTILNADTLEPATADNNKIVVLLAAFLGDVRLIDNLYFELS